MMVSRHLIPNEAARRIFLDRHGLIDAPSGPGKGADLDAVIGRLGFVQLDSVNTVARAHDMILWSRRQQYRPPALQRLHDRDRRLFEHWTHDASTIPIESFPYWRRRFEHNKERLKARWEDWQGTDFHARIDEVLAHIDAEGACKSGDLAEGEGKSSGGWWDWHPSKAALEYLWHTGEISVVRREGFQKVYDLTERVIPESQRHHQVSAEETVDWACRTAIDTLGFATSGEVAAFYALVTPVEAREWCAAELKAGRLIEVDIEGVDGKPRRSFARPAFTDEAAPEPSTRVRILSPFDPALRDRNRAKRLFGFNYRIEIFVPAPKRIYGYYVFPVMEGDRMIGRIDAKADRATNLLDVTAFWPEAGVAMGKGRVARLIAEIERLTTFAGLEGIRYAPDWLRG
jgi:uncharacterized protein YcaQ